MVHQQRWHVVTVGTEPGVYSTWLEAAPKTKNIPGGAIYQSFPTQAEAIRAFEAAKARGEVKAHPDAEKQDKSAGRSRNIPPSSFGDEDSLLKAPLDLKVEAKSTALHTPLSSSARSRVARLRQALKDSETASWWTSSSPPTHVTQVNSLYQDDSDPPDSPVARHSPHFTFTSSSSRAYPSTPDEGFFDTVTEKVQSEVLDWGSPPQASTPLSWDLHPGAEEHTSNHPRCMPLHLDPPSRNKGVKYRSLSDMESVDSRVWLPKSRIFDPAKVKPRSLTRPPSPVKGNISLISNYETADNSSPLPLRGSLQDSSFVRVDRGRHSRLTPTPSLPILPGRGLNGSCSGYESCSTQLLEHRRMGKGKELDCIVNNAQSERITQHALSPRNDSRSHVQLVPRDGRDERSTIVVRCPPNCLHEGCHPASPAVPAVELSLPISPRYVDASVSPIITLTGRIVIQRTDSPTKSPSKRHPVHGDEDQLYELTGCMHAPFQGIAPEADVRSPISRGTMVPLNAAETPFERPSPIQISNLQINRGDI